MAYEACLPFPFNTSLTKLRPPLTFWSSEVRKEWRLGNVCYEGQKTVKILSWEDGMVYHGAWGELFFSGR